MIAPNLEPCSQCGALVAGGVEGCHALYEAFVYQALEDPRLASAHALAFDAYCMQHVERYGISAKSYAAHLMRLCIGVEYGGKPEMYEALQSVYSLDYKKPKLLMERGQIHITDVQAVENIDEKIFKIRLWARSVWDAYASQHDLAHGWVQRALVSRRRE